MARRKGGGRATASGRKRNKEEGGGGVGGAGGEWMMRRWGGGGARGGTRGRVGEAVGGEGEDDDKGALHGQGDDDYDDYNPPHLESDAAAASPYLEPAIPFAFREKETVATAVDTQISRSQGQ